MIILAYVFGVLAAVSNSATNVMQRAANRAESQQLEFSFELIKNLSRRPLWLAGIATMLASSVFQALGLGFGTLAAVAGTIGLIGFVNPSAVQGAGIAWQTWLAAGIGTAIPVGLPQRGVTLADPYVSIIWGAVVFHEAMRDGFWLVAGIVPATAMSAGAIILARSPGMYGSLAASETGQPQPEHAMEAA